MAETVTPKMGLTKPEIGASNNTWGNLLNTNFDLIDVKTVRNSIQWTITPGDDNASSGAGAFIIKRLNNSGVEIDAANPPLSINRQTGDMTVQALNTKALNITGAITISGGATIGGTITGAAITISGGATISGAITGASLSVTGNINSNTMNTNSIAGGAISGSSLNIGGGTLTSGSINSSGNVSIAGQMSSNNIISNGITSNGSIIAAGELKCNGVVRLSADGTRYLHWDGSNYNLPNSHLYTLAGRIWGSSDFSPSNFQPAGNYQPAGAYVTSMRLELASEQTITYNTGSYFEISGAAMTGIQLITASPIIIQIRWRRVQYFTTGWFTAGFA